MSDADPPDGLRYRRVVVKMSGEALQGDKAFGISTPVCRSLAGQLAEIDRMGAQVTVVIGGGNIFRGLEVSKQGMDRASADYMGMLATVMNGLALQDALEKEGRTPRLYSALEMMEIAETFTRSRAVHHLERDGIVIAVAGTGSPYFTTDTAAALRALEIGAEIIFKATKVDGVYDSDPETNDGATKFDRLSFMDVLNRELRVMDSTATSLCMENDMPILVFNIKQTGNLMRAIEGDSIGTLIHGG